MCDNLIKKKLNFNNNEFDLLNFDKYLLNNYQIKLQDYLINSNNNNNKNNNLKLTNNPKNLINFIEFFENISNFIIKNFFYSNSIELIRLINTYSHIYHLINNNIDNYGRSDINYVPYLSKFLVSCVVIFTFEGELKFKFGNNLESNQISNSNCAERCALSKLSSYYHYIIEKIAIVSDKRTPLAPGPLCREYLSFECRRRKKLKREKVGIEGDEDSEIILGSNCYGRYSEEIIELFYLFNKFAIEVSEKIDSKETQNDILTYYFENIFLTSYNKYYKEEDNVKEIEEKKSDEELLIISSTTQFYPYNTFFYPHSILLSFSKFTKDEHFDFEFSLPSSSNLFNLFQTLVSKSLFLSCIKRNRKLLKHSSNFAISSVTTSSSLILSNGEIISSSDMKGLEYSCSFHSSEVVLLEYLRRRNNKLIEEESESETEKESQKESEKEIVVPLLLISIDHLHHLVSPSARARALLCKLSLSLYI